MSGLNSVSVNATIFFIDTSSYLSSPSAISIISSIVSIFVFLRALSLMKSLVTIQGTVSASVISILGYSSVSVARINADGRGYGIGPGVGANGTSQYPATGGSYGGILL